MEVGVTAKYSCPMQVVFCVCAAFISGDRRFVSGWRSTVKLRLCEMQVLLSVIVTC